MLPLRRGTGRRCRVGFSAQRLSFHHCRAASIAIIQISGAMRMFSMAIGPLKHSVQPWICRSCLQNIGLAASARSSLRNHSTTTARRQQHAGNTATPSMDQIRAQYNKKNTTILCDDITPSMTDCSDFRQILRFKPNSRNRCPIIRFSAALQDGRISSNSVFAHTC